jgi:hypothetical protein
MSAITFGTLEFTRRLKDAGFDEKQAEVVVRVLADAQANLVTKEHFDAKFNLLQWMLAFNLAFTMAILWKVFG